MDGKLTVQESYTGEQLSVQKAPDSCFCLGKLTTFSHYLSRSLSGISFSQVGHSGNHSLRLVYTQGSKMRLLPRERERERDRALLHLPQQGAPAVARSSMAVRPRKKIEYFIKYVTDGIPNNYARTQTPFAKNISKEHIKPDGKVAEPPRPEKKHGPVCPTDTV